MYVFQSVCVCMWCLFECICLCICVYAYAFMHVCTYVCRLVGRYACRHLDIIYIYIYLLWHDRTLLKCEICRPTGALAWGDSRTSHLKKLPRQVSPSHSLHQLLHETVQATLLQTSNTMGDKLPHWHLGFPLLTILHGPPFNGEKNMNYADAELFWHRLRDRFFLRMSSSF